MLEPLFELRFDLRHDFTGELISEHATEAEAIEALSAQGFNRQKCRIWKHMESALESHYISLPSQTACQSR